MVVSLPLPFNLARTPNPLLDKQAPQRLMIASRPSQFLPTSMKATRVVKQELLSDWRRPLRGWLGLSGRASPVADVQHARRLEAQVLHERLQAKRLVANVHEHVVATCVIFRGSRVGLE